jgi:large subunit ribosomal protein L11
VVDALVDGGSANPGPPLGPSLGVLGVNTAKVVAEINEKTKDYKGMKVPVKIIVDQETKSFEVKVGSPPVSALVKKELGLEKGTKDGSPVGNLTFKQLLKVAGAKKDSLLAKDMKAAVKEVVGVCQGLGVTVEGRPAKELTGEINEGLFDDVMAGKSEKIPARKEVKVVEKVKIIVEKVPEKEEKPPEPEKKEEVQAAPAAGKDKDKEKKGKI